MSHSDSSVAPPTRVLIVDDELPVRKLLSAILTEANIHAIAVASAEEALQLLKTERIDAVFTDLNMPGMSGMELLSVARLRHPHLAILMITALDDIQVGVKAMKSGAEDYLLKPFEADVVIASLERALRKKHLEKELETHRYHLEEMVRDRTKQLDAAIHEIKSSYEQTLEALGCAIDLRDSETAGHSRRVAVYAGRIATELNATEPELKTIARGAWLHDIGKLAIPDAILLKQGSLTPEEWIVMRSHVQIGYDLVKRIPFLAEAADIILTHHERWDGSGYPQGLRGKEIPLEARIFAVADTVDAMTSDRPYRLALPFEEAIEEIRKGAGIRYDVAVANAFLGVKVDDWKKIPLQCAKGEI